MDKKLLLTVQYVCNAEGVKIPWDKVGSVMGENISDGAVVQHLAKLRIKMVNANLEVPPPLRRGGGVIPNSTSSGRSGKSNSTLSKKSKPTRKDQTGIADLDDENEMEFDIDNASDPEEDFEEARSKQFERDSTIKSSRGRIKVKQEIDDEFATSIKTGDKRKRRIPVSQAQKNKKNEVGAQSTSGSRTQTSKIEYDEADVSDDGDQFQSEGDEQQIDGVQHVASGASFLRLESESTAEEESQPPSKIVVLSLPGHRKNTEQYPDTSDDSAQTTVGNNGVNHSPLSGVETADAAFDEGTSEMRAIDHHLRDDADFGGSRTDMMNHFGSIADAEQMYRVNQEVDDNEIYFNDALHDDGLDPDFSIVRDSQTIIHPSSYDDLHQVSPIDQYSQISNNDSFLGYPLHDGGPIDHQIKSLNGYGSSSFIPIYANTDHRPYQSSNQGISQFYHLGNGKNQNQSLNFGPTASMQIENPGFGFHGTTRNLYPSLTTDFQALNDNQKPALDNDFEDWIVNGPFINEKAEPSAINRQRNQPSVSSEPFSATSTDNNSTPSFASGGDAGGSTPIIGFRRQGFGIEELDKYKPQGDFRAVDELWDMADPEETV